MWNAIAKGLGEPADSFALLNIGVFVFCVVAVPFTGLVSTEAWGYLAAAVVIHQLYELALIRAYRTADFSTSYPVARGVAPLLVSLGGYLIASERLTVLSLAGIALVTVGVVALAGVRSGLPQRDGIVAALATGVAIASYTLVDGLGVRAGHSATRYAATLFLLQSLSWLIAVSLRRGWKWLPSGRNVGLGALGGIVSMFAYSIVLYAQGRTTMGAVSALRETGVVWAAVIGVVHFHEGRASKLIPPALAVAAGVALIGFH